MALILPNQLLVLNAYALLVDETPGNIAFKEHQAFIAANGTSAYASALDSIFVDTSNASLASTMLANLGLGSVFTQAEAEAYLAANSSNRVGAMLDLATQLVGYSGTDAALLAAKSSYVSTLNDSYDFSSNPANLAGESLAGGPVTTDFSLTAGTDHLTGTAAADFFEAFISQNAAAGGVSNTLSSADRIDGGAGADHLYAELVPEFFGASGDNQVDVQPRIRGVETIEFEARDSGGSSFAGEDAILPFNNQVTVDAKNITGVDKIGSAFSDGDLIIENLTTLTDDGVARNTSAITVTMDHTENFNSGEDASDLTVLFDEDYLLAGEINTSTLEIRLVNAFELATNDTPLTAFVAVSFSVGATLVVVPITEEIRALTGAAAYDALVVAIQEQLVTQGVTGVTVSALPVRDVLFSDNVGSFVQGEVAGNYTPIQLVSSDATLTKGQAQLDNTTLDFNGLNTQTNTLDPGAIPITVNVELNKVGRDGEGGDLIIGGKDQNSQGNTDVDHADGIEVFNISVLGDDQLPSNLGYISSTNQALTTVNIATADTTLASFASLTIRDAFNGDGGSSSGHNYNDSNVTNIETVNANAFLGDLIIGTNNAALNIDTFTATGGGDVTLVEDITGAERSMFSVTTGSGADDITVVLDGDAVDALDTGLAISTGSSNDVVTVRDGDFGGGVSDATTLELGNLSISTGSGADEINLNTEYIYMANAGADSDFVRVDGADAFGSGGSFGVWSIGDGTDAIGADWVNRVLYQAELTVDFAGFTQTVTINTTAAGFFIATQQDINNAVIAAIAANPELDRLLNTSVSTGGAGDQLLNISSTVQGLNDLTIQVVQPEVVASAAGAGQVNFNSTHLGAIETGLVNTGVVADSAVITVVADVVTAMATIDGNLNETGSNADLDDFVLDAENGVDGLNNTNATSHAIIDMSTGANDLVALDSDIDSSDTLVFSAVWGKVSVLNFFDAQYNDLAQNANLDATTTITHDDSAVGDHILDFTAFLDDQTSTSTSTLSAVRVATTVQTDGASGLAVLSNQVTIVDDFAVGVDATETWAGLTAANLQNSLNGVDVGTVGTGYGNFDAATATAPANLLGTTIDTIILVENTANLGEYKVFNADVSDLGGTDTFAVTFLGVIDFGESINTGVIGVTDLNFA